MFLFKKAWIFLTEKQKKYAFFIFVLIVFAMIFEILSLGMLIPLLSIFLKGELDTSIFSYFFVFVKLEGENLIYFGLLITFIVFAVKNLFLIYNFWHQNKFLQKANYEFTNKLFKHYLKKDYIFFIQNNSAHLYRNLTSIVASYVSYVSKCILLLGEIIIFTSIIIVLMYVDLFGTSIVLFLSIIVVSLIYIFTKKPITLLGEERNVIGGTLNKHLLQGMASAKDIKILDREEDLIYQVDRNLLKITRINFIIEFIRGVPRFAFELLLVLSFVFLVLLMLHLEREMLDIILYLAIFAVASFRIIPAVSKILSSIQQLRFLEPSIKLLLKEFDSEDNSNLQKSNQEQDMHPLLKFEKEIHLNGLSFSYPTRKEFSLSKISMNIKKGEFVGIIGKTGSGKSTLVNLLIGLLKPIEGEVKVDETNIKTNLTEWHKKIGYVPQTVYLTDDTIRKNIAFGLLEDNIDEDLIKQAIEKACLNEFLDSLPEGLETIVGEKGIKLSGGQQQRIGIARALYRNPEVLILDEATSSLDLETEKMIMESIQFLKRQKTLIIITHRTSTTKNCDKIYCVDGGKIVKQGNPQEIIGDFKI
jgi:ABC-type multidrug transport system fused ATPase/permease subunit|tara:strand:+ start:2264 stop:4024 length:1761 start_codon:yes stop_codon:yes gene_type:complete